MIDGWHGYLDCSACGARPGQPCISLYSHADLVAGQSLLSTPHGGRPHSSDLEPGSFERLQQPVKIYQVTSPTDAATVDVPAAGPIWTNGLAEVEPISQREMDDARAILAKFKRDLEQHWATAVTFYLAQGFDADGYTLSGTKAALLYIIETEEC